MRRPELILIFALLGFMPASLAAGADDATAIFIKGNFAYKDGKYAEAVEHYESLLARGRESAALYYNLGNAYYKAGRLGRAVLNYEKALALSPRDPDIRANARYARSSVRSGSEERAEKALSIYTGYYTADEMAWVMVLLFAALAASHVLSVRFAWPPARTRTVMTTTAVLLGIVLLGFAARVNGQQGRGVALEDLSSRFEPRDEATVHFELPAGAMVRVIGKEEGWVKIERSDGKQGWAQRSAVGEI